jgi:O-antigen ligase
MSLRQYSNMTGMLLLSGNSNQTGMPLGVGCILSLSLWFSGKLSWRRNLAWGVLVLLFSWGVWITTTRSAMLGLVVAASLILYMKTHRKLVWLIPVTLIVAVVSYVCWHWPNPEHYLFSGRVQIWSHIWSVFKLHPWFGQGAQQTYAVILLGHWKLEAHNLYFGIAYYAGVFGLLTYAVLLWLSVRQGRKLTLQMRWIYFPLLVYGLTVHLFEGIYPIYRPHPFWLFTWLPILVLMLADERKSGGQVEMPRGI